MFGAILTTVSAITGLSVAWASVLTLGLVPVILFVAWVIRGIYRGLTESLRKEQKKAEEIQNKQKAIAKRQQFSGAQFGTEAAYSIISADMQDQAIQLAQLRALEAIEANTTREERIAERAQELYDNRTNRNFLGMDFHVTGDSAMAQFRALNDM